MARKKTRRVKKSSAYTRIESAIGAVAKGAKGSKTRLKKAIKDYALHSCAVKMGRKGGTVSARRRKSTRRTKRKK